MSDEAADPASVVKELAPVEAYWSLSLDCECPHCEEDVDLLEYADFWDGRSLDACEHRTSRSRNVSVVCPLCCHEFTVNLNY